MYLVLLAFGAVLAVAGVALAAMGLPIHGHDFDPAIVTPGVVAFVGGLVLFALGLALRILKKIERAVATHPAEQREPVLLPDATSEAAPGAIPTLPRPIPLPSRRVPVTEKRLDETLDKNTEKESERLAAPARPEPVRTAEDVELATAMAKSLGLDTPAPTPTLVVEKEVVEFGGLRASRGIGGTARIAPRLDLNTRASFTGRSKEPGFDLWPKGPRPLRLNQPAPVSPVPAAEPKARETSDTPSPSLSPSLAADTASEPITVLKSGVVDGMAYTLFSDGSIEAALPQGRLRFGSITELRNHIEQSA
ncbi:MAG TPA: hypothetical protein VH206_13615 [Xanthobacteraceae bacterium]|jgi:hypothetical protein|nr:hypothetical protein [Xanthobacteraceae bacterium]